MITNIPDRERDLQAQVDALTEELASVEASNRIRGDELVRLRDEMSKMQQHAAPPADIISRAVANAKYWMDRAEHAEAELERLRAQKPFGWFYDITNGDQKQGPIWQGGEDRKITEIVAEDIGAKVFPLYRAAPPAQPAHPDEFACPLCFDDPANIKPAEPVQRLSDERAAFEAWHNEYRTQELVRRDDTYYNTHVRCRWEGWQARAIESALQPGWRDIESAPKDGSTVIVGRDMGHFGFIRGYARWECSIDGLVPGWISCGFDPVNSNLGLAHPTHWQPIPPAPKATK